MSPRPDRPSRPKGIQKDTKSIPLRARHRPGNKLSVEKLPENCEKVGDKIECKEKVHLIDLKQPEETNADIFLGHAYLVVNAAILSLAFTQILKPFIWKTCSEKSDAVIRLTAVLIGAGIGAHLSDPFVMIDVYMGASAGAINAFVIKMFKAKVKKSLGVDETPEPQKEKDDE